MGSSSEEYSETEGEEEEEEDDVDDVSDGEHVLESVCAPDDSYEALPNELSLFQPGNAESPAEESRESSPSSETPSTPEGMYEPTSATVLRHLAFISPAIGDPFNDSGPLVKEILKMKRNKLRKQDLQRLSLMEETVAAMCSNFPLEESMNAIGT